MAMDFDSQLIESVEVRRTRLTTTLLHGANPTERRWKDRTNLFVYGVVVGAVICAFCVAISFVIMIMTNWLQDRAEREQEQQEREQQQELLDQERQGAGASASGLTSPHADPASAAALLTVLVLPAVPSGAENPTDALTPGRY